MKTPQYSLRQTATDILVSIRCPYIRQSELEYIIADTTFRFYCNPYFLLLEFNTPIGTEKSCSYCVDTGMVEIAIAKHDDAWLPDLDLLTLLKQPAVNPTLNANPSLNPLIEQVEPPKTKDDGLGEQGAPLEFDWLVEQDIQPENVHSTKYGFNNLYHGHAADIYMVANECIEIADIDNLTPSEKRAERIAIENEKFDPDYYIADYLNAEDIQDVLRFKPSTYSALKRVQTHKEPEYADPFLKFSEYENELMMRLANKECTQVANLDLFDHDSLRQAYLGMVDILFAYAFNHRLFMGDNSVESGWTICKLSATLSCFQVANFLI